MQTVSTKAELRRVTAALRAPDADGWARRIALVPTMGALHEGHLTLVRAARKLADHVAVSIFVNPAQFGPNEDFDAYPRQMEADAALLRQEGVALLWAPTVGEVYPDGYATSVRVQDISDGLCGAARPGHFDGVATVVAKLFNQVEPDFALFGEKDWQQLAVIRRMARDLDLKLDIRGVPTVRESDGLALSSRNAYLSAEQRAQVACLPAAMRSAIAAVQGGAALADALGGLNQALLSGGFASVDYAEIRDAENLQLVDTLSRPARLFVAARIGKTRLIDNMPVN